MHKMHAWCLWSGFTYRKACKCLIAHSACWLESPSGVAPCPWAVAALLSCVPSLPPASVCADNHPDQLWGHLAMFVPPWVAVLPDWIHDLSDCSLHKLLYSGESYLSVAVGWDLRSFQQKPSSIHLRRTMCRTSVPVCQAVGSNLVPVTRQSLPLGGGPPPTEKVLKSVPDPRALDLWQGS